MPAENGLGISETTALKQEHLAIVLGTSIAIVQAIHAKDREWADNSTYYYIDLTAGPGGYDIDGRWVDGSPLVFLKEARKAGIHYRAYLIEQHGLRFNQLQANTSRYPNVTCINYPYQDALSDIPPKAFRSCKGPHAPSRLWRYDSEGRKRFGIMYADPTGLLDSTDAIAAFLNRKVYQKLDLLLHLSATTCKRVRGSGDERIEAQFESYFTRLPKAHWLIREPVSRHQWTFLLGTNWADHPHWAKIGFWPLESPRGRRAFDQCAWTAEERP